MNKYMFYRIFISPNFNSTWPIYVCLRALSPLQYNKHIWKHKEKKKITRYHFLHCRSPSHFKEKTRVRACEMWMAGCVEEVCEGSTSPERSFVLGWPTCNSVATFRYTSDHCATAIVILFISIVLGGRAHICQVHTDRELLKDRTANGRRTAGDVRNVWLTILFDFWNPF